MVRATSATLLLRDLGVSQASIYRELKSLVRLGLIERVMPHRIGKGRPYTIYAVRRYAPEDIVNAVERASRAREPAYSLVQSIKQLMLEDYVQVRGLSEVTWMEILGETKVHCGGYSSGDIARMVARELSREGIRIWR